MPQYPSPAKNHSRTSSTPLTWTFPRPLHDFTLIGTSRAAWHTSFVVPELNLLLDAGLCVTDQRPKHIFITHGHSDHTLLSPAFMKADDPPDVFCPEEIKESLDGFVMASRVLDKCFVRPEDMRTSHMSRGVKDGDVVQLRRTKDTSALVVRCDHIVPSVGYVFQRTTNKLCPEYAGLSGHELKKRREAGETITRTQTVPMFAFMGDTTAGILASEPEWLRNGIPVVITECTFLYEEHRGQAQKTKHTIWKDLEVVVRKFVETTFVLTHFSLRYQESDIRRFFQELEDAPRNIVVWVDGSG